MPFPEVDRIRYKKKPLTDVICQFRFPPILKIDSVTPAEFQEVIRERFPLFIEKQEIIQHNLGLVPTDALQQFLGKSSIIKNYEFYTPDEASKVNLTRTFIALSAQKYTQWEEFLDNFIYALKPFLGIYKSPFFTRIGLRYVDVFNRSNLDLKGVDWSELLDTNYLGLLASNIKDRIQNFENSYEITLSDDTSIARVIISQIIEVNTQEKCIKLDADFSTTKRIHPEEAIEKLNYLHLRATRLIRQFIKPKLHEAMGPENI